MPRLPSSRKSRTMPLAPVSAIAALAIAALVASVLLVGIPHATDARPLNADESEQTERKHKVISKALDTLSSLDEKHRFKALKDIDDLTLVSGDEDKVRVDASGSVFFEDTFPLPDDTQVKTTHLNDEAFKGAPDSADGERRRRFLSDLTPDFVTPNNLPIFHSNRGSRNIIFLDFEGEVHHFDGSGWPSFDALPYDPTGNGPSFSSYENRQISLIWARVTEDYAPFDVDVTTEDPIERNSTVLHLLITHHTQRDGQDMPSSRAAGVAFVNVFNQEELPQRSPGLVYYSRAGGLNDFVAEIAAHEAGHMFGLSHDTDADGATSGQGEWGPIMGSPYNRDLSQWDKGEYPGARNFEDDIAVLAGHLGFRADEAGDTPATAAHASYPTSTSLSFEGIISNQDDADWVRMDVVVEAGSSYATIAIDARPWFSFSRTLGSNLNIHLEVRDTLGSILATTSPTTVSEASLSLNLVQGTYFISISGDGLPNVHPSNYGSVGQYELTASVVSGGRFGIAEEAASTLAPPATTTAAAATRTIATTTRPTTTTTAATTTTTTRSSTTTRVSTQSSATCLPDALEPDNRWRSATEYDFAGGRIDGLTACERDSDMFHLTVTCPAGQLTIQTQFQHDLGNINLIVYDGRKKRIARGNSANDNELVSLGFRAPGEYFVRVLSVPGNTGTYSFEATVNCATTTDGEEDDATTTTPTVAPTPVAPTTLSTNQQNGVFNRLSCPEDDSLVGNRGWSAAAPLGQTPIQFTGILCPTQNKDFFSFAANRGETVEIKFTVPSNSMLKFGVYTFAKDVIRWEVIAPTDGEYVSRFVPSYTGSHFIKLADKSGDASAYELTITSAP